MIEIAVDGRLLEYRAELPKRSDRVVLSAHEDDPVGCTRLCAQPAQCAYVAVDQAKTTSSRHGGKGAINPVVACDLRQSIQWSAVRHYNKIIGAADVQRIDQSSHLRRQTVGL